MADNHEETLGQIIKRKRLWLGKSLRDLGRESGVCYAVISRVEDGQVKILEPKKVTALADVLNLDRLFLLSLEGAGVEDKDIRIISRAAGKMNKTQRRQMLKMLRSSFPEAFKNTSSDDLGDRRMKRQKMVINHEEPLGDILMNKRLQLGMSYRELGEESGVGYTEIMRMEQNTISRVDPGKLTALADALLLDRQFLLSLIGGGIEDKDIRIISRAAGKMNKIQRRQMLKMLRESFPDAFRNTLSDDFDVPDEKEKKRKVRTV